jgi:mRNA-degrading endonuclease HigB of HigAB toxin-antitoxin module
MKVRLQLKITVEKFANNHSNGKRHFYKWLSLIEDADWNEPKDMIKTYPCNLLGGGSNRVIFDVGGNGNNSYRIICEYVFCLKLIRLYINWIGTHEEYNALSEHQKRTISNY